MFVSHPLLRENTIEKRTYQEAIAKTALKNNTLVVAPTALGKTVIAVLVAASFLLKIPDRKVLVLAPTRPLVAQHAARLKSFLKVDGSQVAVLTGHVPPEKRKEIWLRSKVICATPHVILNDFRAGRYGPGELSFVVFDEAHRAVGDYPYPQIASLIDCHILALTASPGADPATIREVVSNLHISNVEVRDESDPDVAPYFKGFKINWIKVELPEPYIVLRNLLRKLLKERLEILKRERVIKSARIEITKKELLALMVELQRLVSIEKRKDLFRALSALSGGLTIMHAIDLLETQGAGPLNSYLQRTLKKARSPGSSRAVRELAFSRDFMRALEMSDAYKTKLQDPKMESLRKVVIGTKKDTKIIVFTQYRDTAQEIVKSLNTIEGVRAVRFVGQASKTDDPGLSQKDQLELIKRFKKGESNVLVATSVAEEGLDIPSVDLVVFYEPVPSEIRTIQRRGRTGRTDVGEVIVLVTQKTRDEGFYWSSLSRERRMKRSLKHLKEGVETLDKFT